MELGPQNHNGDGLLGGNSIIVVYMDPLGADWVLRAGRLQCAGLLAGSFWLQVVEVFIGMI